MHETDATSLLNRLLHLMVRSFPAYSVMVRAASFRGPEEMLDLLRRVADQQRQLGRRISESVREQKGTPDPGQFPIAFTAWNDVALPRVLQHAAELLEQTASEADAIAGRQTPGAVFHFAREVAGQAGQHAALLRQALAAHVGTA